MELGRVGLIYYGVERPAVVKRIEAINEIVIDAGFWLRTDTQHEFWADVFRHSKRPLVFVYENVNGADACVVVTGKLVKSFSVSASDVTATTREKPCVAFGEYANCVLKARDGFLFVHVLGDVFCFKNESNNPYDTASVIHVYKGGNGRVVCDIRTRGFDVLLEEWRPEDDAER